ncbi:uncharacterized protein [Coffea arabica]|uniref:Uncharacterized protein n=1 Tax=Coffea arabica TaxID=13443 RepID=A0A6P6U691_COFAR|nr:uncharacterized protein LOC113707995 [Coffea arabica]
MADFEPPSFSLGFDLDLDPDPEPQTARRPEPSTSYNIKPAKRSSAGATIRSNNNDEEEDDFETPTMGFKPQVSDTPRTLKRLRRGPTLATQKGKSKEEWFNVDDEIEEFSSQEDPSPVSIADNASKHHNSICGSSKFTLTGHGLVASQSAIQAEERKKKEVSNASTCNRLVFPELHVSPLRKFQLIDSDSDSDEPSPPGGPQKVVNQVEFSSKDRASGPHLVEAAAEVKKSKASVRMSQSEDLWKEIHSEKTLNIPTPAFDEVCEEYFRSVKGKNGFWNCDKDCYETSNFSKNNVEEHVAGPQPPAHAYYYHEDPRIQKLVHSRLPNFFPLEAGNNQGQKQLNACPIDYMGQFNQREIPKHGKKGPKNGPSSTRSQKSARKSSVQELSQESESWINPRCSAKNPKDAGKRRIHAVGKSSGHWYTAADGRRVYVAGNGQELTGQIAYRQYRRESGAGFKKSKKKAATKKKPARKKK